MPKALTLDLSDEERDQLKDARDHHEKPYIRERATALLKIDDGQSGRTVALEGLLKEGLLKERKPDTVYGWYHRCREEGFDGLFIKEGRGLWARLFPPNMFPPNMTRQKKPKKSSFRSSDATRGRLSSRRVGPWRQFVSSALPGFALRPTPVFGACLIDSGSPIRDHLYGITYKRGRHYTYSPDPDYQEKRDYIQKTLDQVREEPERQVLLYQVLLYQVLLYQVLLYQVLLYQDECQDECGYYRKPSLAKNYEAKGKSLQPRAHLAHASKKEYRIAGCINAVDGRVHFRQAESISTDELIQFYGQFYGQGAEDYSEAETIYVVQDNWPVHFHADLIGHLEKDTSKNKSGPGPSMIRFPLAGLRSPKSRLPRTRCLFSFCASRPMPRG